MGLAHLYAGKRGVKKANLVDIVNRGDGEDNTTREGRRRELEDGDRRTIHGNSI